MDSETVSEITEEMGNQASCSSSSSSFVHAPLLKFKLNENNYFSWTDLVLAILKHHSLHHFVLDPDTRPPEFLHVPAGSAESQHPVPNPPFEEWTITDQDLRGWLLASMTQPVASRLVGLSTSREVWKAVEQQMYGETSGGRINRMLCILQNIRKKPGTSMIEYLATIKEISENLNLAGAPVSISDLTSYVLRGLEPEIYTPIVQTIKAQEISQWQHLYSQLIDFKTKVKLRLVYINDPERTNKEFDIDGNSIRTSKYTILTFLPMNLFEQFHRIAYLYFLVLAVLSQLPQLAVFGPCVSIFPLSSVLLVTAVKDAYVDWRKQRSDNSINNREASVLINGHFQTKKWKDIRVGEIVKVHENEAIPCDMVLLSTTHPTGVAYVNTMTVDGEPTLKTAKQETMSKRPEEEKISGLITCEELKWYYYRFEANMEIDGANLSLGNSNILLRGCELKNTGWVVGVVVYAGCQTRAILYSSSAPSKRSRLEMRKNVEIIILSFFLTVLCIVVSVCSAVWFNRKGEGLDILPYFRKKDFSNDPPKTYKYYGRGLDAFFAFLMSAIMLQIMVPISLYISMDLVRLGQNYFMIKDVRMYDETTNSGLQCQALSINEDLGQIRYVFSAKTALTENKMEFRCASIGGIKYEGERTNPIGEQSGYSIQVNGKVLRPKMAVNTNLELLGLLKSGKHTDKEKYIHNFFLGLAACNTIFPLITKTSNPSVQLIEYHGACSDEQALVYAAAAYGFMLIERTAGHIVINVHGEKKRYNILEVHNFDPYDPDKRRMSVILKCPDTTFKVFVKDFDSYAFDLLSEILNKDILQATKAHLRSYSSEGLRTVVIGMKELSPYDFDKWHFMYEEAKTDPIKKDSKLLDVSYSLENNLSILGASCIADKLQKGVPEAIKSLRTAGIKLWVLTEDTQEKVISFGYSSGLLTNKMPQINLSSKKACRRILENATIMSKKFASVPGAMLDISGKSTEIVTASIALIISERTIDGIKELKLQEQFLDLVCCCSVVLCCEISRKWNDKIVSFFKGITSDRILVIGDGVDDMQMIEKADVGISISGKEGQEAVIASDFSIGQFRFLVPLLLVHGHWNYQRMRYMILHTFYRNVVFVFVLFWYVLFTSFSLTSAINQWSNVLYSVISTCFPSIVVGILDQDLSRSTLLRYPQLYGAGHRQEGYNSTLFWLTMIDAVWQSITIFFIPLLAYWATTIDVSSLGDLWLLALVIVVNLHLAMDIVRWNFIIHAVIWGSIFATVISVIVLDSLVSLPGYWAIYHVAGTASFWLCLLAIIVVALLPRFVVKYAYQYCSPSDVQVAREVDKFGRTGELGEVQTSNRDDPSPQ